MMLQAAVSLLNIGSYRLAAAPAAARRRRRRARRRAERDLEQVRDAIDGVRALLEILERRVPGELGPLRDALSQLQMAYAREVQARGASRAERAARRAGRRQGRPQAAARAAPEGPATGGPAAGQGPAEPASGRAAPAAARARPSPAAGCGCPAAERRPVPARAARAALRARTPAAPRHDRLRRAFAPGGARHRATRSTNVRATILARHANQTAEDFLLSSFLTNHGVVVALVCAACAVVYGLRDHALAAGALARQREDAEHLAGRPAGRARLPEPPVRDDRGRRRRAVRRADLHPEHRRRRRLR